MSISVRELQVRLNWSKISWTYCFLSLMAKTLLVMTLIRLTKPHVWDTMFIFFFKLMTEISILLFITIIFLIVIWYLSFIVIFVKLTRFKLKFLSTLIYICLAYNLMSYALKQ
jgi:hypothetical protein